jgi:hypothetical protein
VQVVALHSLNIPLDCSHAFQSHRGEENSRGRAACQTMYARCGYSAYAAFKGDR